MAKKVSPKPSRNKPRADPGGADTGAADEETAPEPTATIMGKASLGQWLRESSGWIALAGVVLYFLGFILVNGYLGQFGVADFALLRFKYISAATLFLAISAVPAAIGVVFWRESKSIADKANKVDRIIFPMAASSIVGYVLWCAILLPPVLAEFYYTRKEAQYGAAVWIVSLMLARSLKFGWPASRGEAHLYHVLRVTAWVGVLLLLIYWFQVAFYGNLKPSLGGGGGWLAKVAIVEPPEGPPKLATLLGDSVAIVDRNGTSLLVVACDDGRRVPLEIPYRLVQWIEVRRMISMEHYCVPIAGKTAKQSTNEGLERNQADSGQK